MKKVILRNPSSSYLDDLPFEDLERLIKETEQRIARLSDEYYKYDGTTGHGHQKQKYIKREIDTLKRDLKGYGQSWERKMRNGFFDSFPLNTSGGSRSHIPQVESLNRADSFYIIDEDSGSKSASLKTRHAAEKLAARLNKSEKRKRYYVLGIEYEENRRNPYYNLRADEIAELLNLWHISHHAGARHDRMLWTTREFIKLYPQHSSNVVYKNLDRQLKS